MLLILVFSGASCSSLAARFKETEQTTESQETKETRTTKQNKQTKEILKTVWFLLPRGGLSILFFIISVPGTKVAASPFEKPQYEPYPRTVFLRYLFLFIFVCFPLVFLREPS